MSKFFPGQKARLVRPLHPEHLNMELRILSMFPETHADTTYPVNCLVEPISGKFKDGVTNRTHTDRLEPILPDGAQPSEWKNVIVWDPSLIKEKELCTVLVIV